MAAARALFGGKNRYPVTESPTTSAHTWSDQGTRALRQSLTVSGLHWLHNGTAAESTTTA
ncbi:MAG: hypothetical protein ACLR8Y_19620 [Alistipes indistinctus]